MEHASSTSAHAGERPPAPAPFGPLPVLVYDHGFDQSSRRHTVVRIAAAAAGGNTIALETTRVVVPELTSNDYHVTPHGWVFLSEPPAAGTARRTRLWNPTTGESVELPRMEQPLPANWKCYLSDDPTAASCVVLVLAMSEPSLLYCHVGATGGRWVAHEYDIGNVNLPAEYAPAPQPFSIEQTAAVGGRFYFVETGKLGVLEFTPSPEINYMDYPRLELPDGSNCGTSFLVASHGAELFEVHVFFKGFTMEILAVRVCAIDLSGERPAFREVGDLGDRAFLLSDANAALLCSASAHGVKGNRVYFMHNVLDEPDGGLLRVYSLGDGKMEVATRPCLGVSELMCNPFWMMPADQCS
uniref:KIB1-4 beta-propeller domain-containing protein n=1 Tax=Oryza meridionalis TaxID=40149 RepID=A0A0E0CB82_9ORYZ